MEQFGNGRVEHHAPGELAAGYSPAIRALEIASILAFFVVVIWQMVRMYPHAPQHPWLMLAAFVAGYLFADWVSGFVHWAADTWGSVDMPLIGKALIRPFREHHVDQEAITHHDFIETNGNNCLICVPAGTAALFVPLDEPWLLFLMAWLLFSMLWVLGTNQFHKWSHLRQIPPVIAFLQRWHLILPPEHHKIHHTAPYDTHYSITTGWMNRPLAAIRFYRGLEWAVNAVTGLVPRADDLGKNGAKSEAP